MSAANDIRLIELKDTIAQLNTTIKSQTALIQSLQQTIDSFNKKESEKDLVIKDLRAQMDFLKQKLFGSTSEPSRTVMEGQMNLFQDPEEDEKPAEIIEPEVIEVSSYKKARKKKSTYEELFENLPVRDITVDTLTSEQKTCAVCSTQMVVIGHEVIRTELRYTEPKLERVRYIGTTWACPECKDTEDNEFVKDNAAPPALIKGSYVSSGLAAHVMYAKYVLGLPLYRLEKDFEQLGAKISRTTMASWIIDCSEQYLSPVCEYLRKSLVKRKYLMADETPLQVLNEPGRRAQSRSYVWVVRTGEDNSAPIIMYRYTPTRARYNIAAFLRDMNEPFV